MPVSSVAPISITLEEITIFGTGTQTTVIRIRLFWCSSVDDLPDHPCPGPCESTYPAITDYSCSSSPPHGLKLKGPPCWPARPCMPVPFSVFIFIDPGKTKEDSLKHILEHEGIHKREWHSIDRHPGRTVCNDQLVQSGGLDAPQIGWSKTLNSWPTRRCSARGPIPWRYQLSILKSIYRKRILIQSIQ